MYELLLAPFADFGFMRRALVGCLALALGATPVGVFLLLRRMSLMGDAMSHAILPGAALGYLAFGLSLGAMTIGGIIAGLVVVFAAGIVTRASILKEDASLAAFYLLSLAAGVMIVSLRGRNLDLLHVLFGSVLALDDASLILISAISSVTVLGLALLFRPLVLECFDPSFLRAVSRLSPVAHYGFLMLVVLNLVSGFHALGTLMAVGIMILPSAAARLWARSLPATLLVAVLIAFGSGLIGLLVSFHIDVPAGPAIVLMCGVAYFASLLAAPGGVLAGRLPVRRHLES
ncbi:metal ABC transporter permease [Azoarcus communis]|uniref:Metal ABC transporter permease n=1 Tax=Parazoarcus communis SWub3 = DSM 12120 TaxID=1121029 RepID=A0A323US95_9RHOO|nr:metal ABC transporter permease [Parazoarcus communis]NMG50626.1 metal ABC transporter permease [Parazoarcus communis]NMG71605.1 metal ABC transporter permease [Parazoarcus communis SWub3 = DSM 12120]PZA15359.1 metal ABC transporter permease [Azoarcus communis] [Parazoarcus communis SWub3 = DSM 12120]